MIKIHFQLPEPEINKPNYEDQTTFDAFKQLVEQMKQAGLQPVKFFGQASPFLVYTHNSSIHNSFIDQFGDTYAKENGVWKKTGKGKSMKELVDLPETVPHPKKPEWLIKTMRIFPAAIGMPKSVDELVTELTEVSQGFEEIDMTEYIPDGEDIWTGPTSNPQALAYFTGKHHSKFALYVGSNGYIANHNLNEIGLKQTGSDIQAPELELVIKTNYGDCYVTDKPGPTLMSVAQYTGPLGRVITETISHDIKVYNVPPETPFTEIPLVKGVLETGLPDREEKKKYVFQ